MDVIKGDITIFISTIMYPHNMGEEYGNFVVPTYLTLDVAIKNHPDRAIIKFHKDSNELVDVEVVYRGKFGKVIK